MGKPYLDELSALPATLRWASVHDSKPLRSFWEKAQGRTLYAVGVGGSFTAAKFAARLHGFRGDAAVAQTTYEFSRGNEDLRYASVILFTGGGNNRDVLAAFDWAIAREAQSILVVCASLNSKISERLRNYWHADLVEFRLGSGGDGFLATNTLLATCCLLARASGMGPAMLRGARSSGKRSVEAAEKLVATKRTELLVLSSGFGEPAGADLESKCSEAALAAVLHCDYRHFAHGRHVWIAKRPENAALVALITPEEAEIAERTLAEIPLTVPIIRLESKRSKAEGAVDLLVQVFHFVAGLGIAVGRDPGRPGVPSFGRRIYNLPVQPKPRVLRIGSSNLMEVACSRKRAAGGSVANWENSYRRFLHALNEQAFGSLVFDFDGTLCGARDRHLGVTEALQRPLIRILEGGARIAIATGRGDSCRDSLRSIVPTRFWSRVLIGYHNGSEIAALDDEAVPKPMEKSVEPLRKLLKQLKLRNALKHCHVKEHRCQLTLKTACGLSATRLAAVVQEIVARDHLPLNMVQSSHSFDVLSCEASKTKVVRAITASGQEALCVGDRGAFPGNDFELLTHKFSLSVDQVSNDTETCWNLAPAGVRCEQATLFYLCGIDVEKGNIRYSLGRSIANFKAYVP